MPKIIPIQIGQRFEMLSVVAESDDSYVKCQCDCGSAKNIKRTDLRAGNRSSCGCNRGRPTHRMEGTPTYNSWAQMLSRCRNSNNKWFHRYGGRGIAVCERWGDFRNFYADMGAKPGGLSIDRIDNDGNYEPGNCRWATVKEQLRNRCVTLTVEYEGGVVSTAELAERHGLSRKLVQARLKRGLSVSEALSPVRSGRWGETSSSVRSKVA